MSQLRPYVDGSRALGAPVRGEAADADLTRASERRVLREDDGRPRRPKGRGFHVNPARTVCTCRPGVHLLQSKGVACIEICGFVCISWENIRVWELEGCVILCFFSLR